MKMNRFSPIVAFCLALTLQPGHVMRTIDGDTFVLYTVDAPPENHVRLLGVDAEELRTQDSVTKVWSDNPKGQEAKTFTESWLAVGPFRFMSCKKDSFGRRLATIMRSGVNLADELKVRGLGK